MNKHYLTFYIDSELKNLFLNFAESIGSNNFLKNGSADKPTPLTFN